VFVALEQQFEWRLTKVRRDSPFRVSHSTLDHTSNTATVTDPLLYIRLSYIHYILPQILTTQTLTSLIFHNMNTTTPVDPTVYYCIGKGCCGSIWTSPRTPNLVIKLEDGADTHRFMASDRDMHRRAKISV
jgi:hypothetical protein